jgi:hypothetical protein
MIDKEKEGTTIEIICLNCDHHFKGNFCPNCGQAAKEFDQPFGFVFYDFLGNFFSFDSRLFLSIKYLLFNPGRLTIDFFKGKRASFTPPFRLFIFASFFLFLMLQLLTVKTLDKTFDGEQLADSTLSISTSLKLDSAAIDSIAQPLRNNVDENSTLSFVVDSTEMNQIFSRSSSVRSFLGNLADMMDKEIEKLEENEEKEAMKVISNLVRSPDGFSAQVLKYTSWAFFLMLPLFALLLALFYRKQKYHFIRHLIFSIHLHSFLFIILSLIVAVKVIFTGAWTNFTFLLLPVILIYYMIASIKFYHGRWLKTIFKSLSLWMLYGLLSFGTVILVIMRVLITSIR